MNEYGTHQRMLLRAALRTTGPILELGVGWYSTPILREVATFQNRTLFSMDNDYAWLAKVREGMDDHELHYFKMLDRTELNPLTNWGLVFVDHGPPPDWPKTPQGTLNALDRGQAVLDLMDRTDVFVLHDTQPGVRWEYDWDKVLPLFKFVHHDNSTHPKVFTTVLSNVIDVTQWQ